MRAILFAALPVLLLATTEASAQVAPAANPYAFHRREEAPRSYGWQTITADGATVVTTILVSQSESAPWVFLGGYLFSGPVIHWAHGNVGTGFGSLAMRAAAPIAGAYMGCALDSGGGGYGCLGGAALGLLAGYITAVTVDAAALAYEDASGEQRVAKRTTPTIVPSAAFRRDGATFGLQAMF